MTLSSAALTLFLVMDPLGNIPFFISILSTVEEKKRRFVVLRESMIAFVILCIFLFFGRHILHSLNITEPALRLSGGIILFIISLKMIFPDHDTPRERQLGEPFIVPLAIPLLAGPSALATVLIFATQWPSQMLTWLGALTISSVLATITLLFSTSLQKFLGEKGLVAIERLMGMILTTVSVQMFLSGIDDYRHGIL